jgi:hypothetical protein
VDARDQGGRSRPLTVERDEAAIFDGFRGQRTDGGKRSAAVYGNEAASAWREIQNERIHGAAPPSAHYKHCPI